MKQSKLRFGGDYNPEQWSRDVWKEDIELMQRAGVNLVSLGIFSWSKIEQRQGEFHFDWLDDAMQLLHEGGIGIDMATATASPPAWLVTKYPSVLPVNGDGIRSNHGGRQAYCPSSPIYRELAATLVDKIAERYATHPGVEMWHVNNEYGCHNPHCFCHNSADAFRLWLQKRYGTLDELNAHWCTDFWSQRYYDWNEVIPPKRTPDGTHPNPMQQLDFRRFSSDALLELFVMERDIIKKHDKVHPVTTNFMSMRYSLNTDYWQWAKEVDFVSTDHYLPAHDPENHLDLALQADMTRGFAGGDNWLLMEHSTSAVNWQPRNYAKPNGGTRRDSLSHVARGSQGAMFFQWRASIGGSERFHSALVPHAGADSRVYRAVEELGSELKGLADLSGHKVDQAEVAIIQDYDSWWLTRQPNMPTQDIDYTDVLYSWYKSLWRHGVRVDFLPHDASAEQLAKYKVVAAPMLHMISDEFEQRLIDYTKQGGNLLVSYFSAVADRSARVRLGGYGGRLLRELCGLRIDEFAPLEPGQNTLDNGMKVSVWSEFSRISEEAIGDVEVLAKYATGVAAGHIAITAAKLAKSTAWYQGTQLDDAAQDEFMAGLIASAGLKTVGGQGLEVVTRGAYTFVSNYAEEAKVAPNGSEVAPGASMFYKN
jgi:beta-galactosidase